MGPVHVLTSARSNRAAGEDGFRPHRLQARFHPTRGENSQPPEIWQYLAATPPDNAP